MYRAGIIGCGRIGAEFKDSHFNAYINNPKIKLMAQSDTKFYKKLYSPEVGKINEEGIMEYSDYRYMVKFENLDIVSVCTPPETHAEVCYNIAPLVRAVIMEKPIATTLDEADKMIEVCKENNTILQINHQRRWMRPKFKFSRGILNSGSHAFDLVNFLFKDPSIVDFEYIDTDEYIFEFNLTHSEEPLLPRALDHLIWCLETGNQSISSGEDGREALRQCLEFEELRGKNERRNNIRVI